MKNFIKLTLIIAFLSAPLAKSYGMDNQAEKYAAQMAIKLMKKTSPNTGYNAQYFIYDIDYSYFSQTYMITMSAYWKGRLCLLCDGEETFEIKGRLSVKKDGSSYNFFETSRNSAVRNALTEDKIELVGDLVEVIAESSSSNYSSPSNSRKIYVKNECSEAITIAIKYRYDNDDWTTNYWYTISPNSSSYLLDDGYRIKSNNSIVYLYGKSDNYYWSGDKERIVGTEYYNMKEYTMSTDANGDYVISLNCNN